MSFRHLSAIFKVARYDDPGGAYRAGDVLWKLGGRDSDFTFEDENGSPETGPCAQHTAVQLDNGNIVAFDNGAWNLNPLCVDPEDPTGDPVARTPTRIAEWELDHETGVATMVRDVQIGNRYAIFAGSAQPLADGNIMIGWASANQQALATEVDAQDRTVWELRAVEAPQYFTYRAYRQEVPDRIEPEATIVSPAPGAEVPVGSVVSPVVECSDRGGSSLVACDADPVDTLTPGVRTVTVTARDGAGNVTRSAHTYTVVAPATPTPAPPVPSSTPVPTPPAPAPVPAAEDERLPDLHAKVAAEGAVEGRGRPRRPPRPGAAPVGVPTLRRPGQGPERRLGRRPVPAPGALARRGGLARLGGSHASYAAARAGGVVVIPPGRPPGTCPAPHRRPDRGALGR